MRKGERWVPTKGKFSFDQFCLDTITGELRREQAVLKLGKSAFDVLHYLVEHADAVLQPGEIQQAVWGDVFVDPGVVKWCIRQIRGVLADDWRRPRFIQTQRGRGYRFIMPVSTASQLKAVDERLVEVVLDKTTAIGPEEAKATLHRLKGVRQSS
jgi:DNA-binding winged helix-turn-helix (wHTH) protein